MRSSQAGCSGVVPCFIFSSRVSGFFMLYLVSISWISARVDLSLDFRYSLRLPLSSFSGGSPRVFETLSISSSVSVISVTLFC